MESGKNVYMDNASSTRLDERVMEAMEPYLFNKYAVATSEFGHSMGVEAKEGLDAARGVIADRLGADFQEIVFTSGSTESSNLALKGVMSAKRGHLIVSKIEDFSVLHTAKKLERAGCDVSYLPVDGEGLVDPESLKNEIRGDTVLVSVQHANQEIGTLQNIKELADVCRDAGVLFHTDATHTFTRIPLDVKDIPVDLITLSPHTIHGPKGIGALYIRDGTPIKKQMEGGFQEFDKRGGLENIPGAVGFAKAVELVTEEENRRLEELRDRIIDRVLEEISDTTLNGPRKKRVPQNANITFHYVEGESITLHMDMRGVALSTGSACFSRSLEASHVILGIGGDHERAHGSVRFSLGRYSTREGVDYVVDNIKEVVERLREISPLGKE
ncbi:MAG: cysteine desulfurase family protein [Thermoplasmata archaeon]